MADLMDIGPGDKVKIGLPNTNAVVVIATVIRVTRNQIVLTHQDVSGQCRYDRKTGYKIGGPGFCIKGVATPEDVAAFEHKRSESARCIEATRKAMEESQRRRRELESLFPPGYQVEITEDTDRHGRWVLTFGNLTEDDIRLLSITLAESGDECQSGT